MTTTEDMALRLVNRFNGFYDVYHGAEKVAVVSSHHKEWTVRLHMYGRPQPWAWTAPTRRSALAVFADSEGYSL